AVVTAPVVRPDGSIFDRPGYCRKTRLLLDPADPDGMASVPLTPSIDQARQALDRLLFPFETFPFVNETARGAMLAALLTAAARPVLPTSPAFAFDAPTQGSGKTLLALCVGALLEGRDPGTWSHAAGRDDEETRKRLFTALLSGAKAIVWDNVVGAFDSASMAAALTSPSMTDRILGKSESHQLPNRALILFTGNNFSLKGDMIRRVLVCRIDPGIEAPHKRSFDLDPLAYTLANRTEMLRDACILLRARFVYQTERAPGSLASFEAWDAMVRQTVVWADAVLRPGAFGDPVDLIDAGQADDPEREALGELLEALREKFGSSEFTAKQVKTAITDAAFGVSF